MGRIIDAGHYYLCHGPTFWSMRGWELAEKLRTPSDDLLLFIDDIHTRSDLNETERALAAVDFQPKPNLVLFEKDMIDPAQEMLGRLQKLSKKKRARQNGKGKWFCSGNALTDDAESPLCSLLDAGLTLYKSRLGYDAAVNILPYFYENQQLQLLSLLAKALPEFPLTVILFDEEGNYWNLKKGV